MPETEILVFSYSRNFKFYH